ncbi:MAG: hypothetical protein PWQ95_248, partial [Thermococcaceae archaeon]|nr:hypothetical protein [Thermococcaceae archaeon]
PLQYIDKEKIVTPELMDLAYKVNYEVSKVARRRKVRVSVRVPSFEIMCWDCDEETLEEVRSIIRRFGGNVDAPAGKAEE